MGCWVSPAAHFADQLVMDQRIIELPLGERREPTCTMCVDECGSNCCKAPFTLELQTVELGPFRRAAEVRSKRFRVESTGPGVFTLRFEESDGSCPMLEADGMCSYYEKRPEACRLFPRHPNPHCLAWPGMIIPLDLEVR